MRRVLFIIAFALLANPIASNVDVLPDLFGYILIMIAIFRCAHYDETAKKAYICTRNMAIVSFFKLISVYFSTMVVDATISLLFSFTFFAVELVFGIPFILKIFDYSSQRALKTGNQKAIKIADGVKIATIVMFALRLLLSTAPDFVLLTASDPLSLNNNDLTSFRPVLIVFSVLISSILSLAWLPLESYFFAITFTAKESVISSNELNEKLPNKKLHFNLSLQRKMIVALCVLSFCVFEIRIDNIDVFFNTVLPLAFISFYLFLLIKRNVRFDKLIFPLIGVTVVQAVVNIIIKVKTRAYFEEYTLLSVFKISQAETKYYSILPILIISWCLFVGALSLSMLLLIRSAKNTLFDNIEACSPNSDREFTVSDFKKRARLLFILPVASSVGMASLSSVAFAFMPRIDELTKVNVFGRVFNLPIFPSIVPVQMALTLGFVALFIYSLVKINDNVYKKLHNKISFD